MYRCTSFDLLTSKIFQSQKVISAQQYAFGCLAAEK